MSHFAEHRLIRYRASTFRPLSSGGDKESVQNARERDRTLIRKTEETGELNRSQRQTEEQQVSDLNKAGQGSGMTFDRRSGPDGTFISAYNVDPIANADLPGQKKLLGTLPFGKKPVGAAPGSQLKRAKSTTLARKQQLTTMQQRVAARKQKRLNEIQAQGRSLDEVVKSDKPMSLADFQKNNLDPNTLGYEEIDGAKYVTLPGGMKVKVESDIGEQAAALAEQDRTEQEEIDTEAQSIQEDETTAQQEDRAGEGTPEETPDQTQQTGDELIGGLFEYASQNPEFAASFLPQLSQLAQLRQNNNVIRGQALQEHNATDLNQDGVTDGVAASVDASRDALKVEKDEADRIINENKNIALEAAAIAKDMAQIEKDRFELNQVKRENELRDQNLEAEIRNRRISGKLGIGGDTNGLQWMQKEVRRGNEALANLSADGDLIRQGYALAIGRQYNLDVRSAINGYDAAQATNNKVYASELRELDKFVTLDAADRRKEKQAIEDKHAERSFQTELKAIDMLDKATQNMLAMKKEAREAKAAEKKDARDGLKWLVETYGSNADPQALAHYTSKLGEDGSWFKSVTLAEMKQAEGTAVTPVQTFEAQNSLRKEFTANGIYQSHEKKAASFDTITNSVTESNRLQKAFDAGDKSAKESMLGSDTAMLYSFIKLLDDTSAVREGEIDLVQSAQSYKTKVLGFIQRAEKDGTTLTVEQRNSILAQAESINQYADIRFNQLQQDTAAMIEDANTRLGLGINPKSILGADWYPGGAAAADAAMEEGGQSEEQYQSKAEPANGSAPSLTSWMQNFKNPKPVQSFDTKTGYKVHGELKHNGLDLDGKGGDKIPAFRGGIVKFAKKDGGYGNKVVIQDPATGYQFVYAHLREIKVKEGQRIGLNALVGLMGNTGHVMGADGKPPKPGDKETGSHLHFEMLDANGKPIDPEGFDFGGNIASSYTRS